ncbi:MAG TPA: lysyl oxidase family protein [Gemmatimonadales bacterium]|nr:lysyl oxidase family protein [Gemmatimonadales bacterium]
MYPRYLSAILGVTLVVACSPDQPTPGEESAVPSVVAAPAALPGGLPDLIVDARRLAASWAVYDQSFPSTSCSVQESEMSPGDHRVLRFTVSTPNVGTGDVYVGDPLAHMAANDGLFEYAACHAHLHFRNYATYELVDPAGQRILLAAKRGFCMLDVARYKTPGGPKPGKWRYRSCGTLTTPGDQGISPGWADVYDKQLDGQFFVLDEAGAPVPPGNYVIRITVNPPFVCGTEDDARPRDAQGMCHNFAEANYDNNVGEAPITVPAVVGSNGAGPGGGAPAPKLGMTHKTFESQ